MSIIMWEAAMSYASTFKKKYETSLGPKRRIIRLKKKILCLKACENFSNRRGVQFLIFYLFIFFYFNWPLPPRTSETKNDWKVSTSVFSEIKRDFTRFLSSHVLKFFQNSKLSSFFVVKMKKKIISRKKKWKSEFCKTKCAQKNKCGRQLWDTEFFFFSLTKWEPYLVMYFQITLVSQRHLSVLVNKHCAFYVNELSIGPCMCYIQDASVWWQASPLTK